jgi:uncharacterized FlaG/YvyC family protein
MSRIDAKLAIPVADTVRPVATAEDHQVQQQAARSRATRAPSEEAPSSQDVLAAAEQVRQVIEVASGRQLSFDMDDSGKTLLFKITGNGGEVIKQIPSREVLELRERIEALVGTMVDERA